MGDGYVTYLSNTKEAVPLIGNTPNDPTNAIDMLEDLLLHHYNNELELVKEVRVNWTGRRSNRGLFEIGNRLIWVYEEQETKGEATMWCQIVNLDGTLGDRYKALDFEPKNGYIYVESAISLDKSKRGFVFSNEAKNRIGSQKDDEKSELNFLIFDVNGKLVNEASKKLTSARNQFDLRSVGITNEGKLFAAAKIFDNGKRKEVKGGSKTKLYVYSLAPKGTELTRTSLRTSGAYLTEVSLNAAPNGEVNLYGLYRTEEYKGNVGVFHVLGLSEESTSIRKRAFPQKYLEKLGKHLVKKSKGELELVKFCTFRDALSLQDGSQALLLEILYVEETDAKTIRYTFKEGIILSCDSEGKITSMNQIPKAQLSYHAIDPYNSLKLVEYNGKAAVVYNDNIKNLDRSIEQPAKLLYSDNAVALIAYVGEDGTLVRKPLFLKKEMDNMMIMPNSVKALESGEVIFMTAGGKMLGDKGYGIGRLGK